MVFDGADCAASLCGIIVSFEQNAIGAIMKKWDTSKTEINGFKIIKDGGRVGTNRPGVLLCKVCNKEFESNLYYASYIKSCGCLPSSIQDPLPAEINGFKIVKDLGRVNGKTRKAIVICKVCSREYEAQAYYLKDRKHCGCLRGEELVCSYRKSHPRLITIYKAMRARCYYEKDKNYHLYGAKGIKIYDQWKQNPDSFCEWALKNGYAENLSIDRKNNNDNYCPENCQWSDAKTQARNRKGIKLTLDKAKSIRNEIKFISKKELCEKYEISINVLNNVLANKHWVE